MRIIRAEESSVFPLGRLGENEATTVVFDISEWRESFGEGTVLLLNRRNGDSDAYPCVIEQEGNEVRWRIKSADVAAVGYGQCELIYTVGDTIVKSRIYSTFADTALNGENGNVPEPWTDWAQEIMGAIDCVEQVIAEREIPTSLSALTDDSTHRLVTDAEKAVWDGKYSKPDSGIPKTDLASAVKASLGRADTALQSETDPTVPSWAKQESKPSYTAAEVGARADTWVPSKSDVGLSNVANERQYSASNPPPYPVTSVNGRTGEVSVAEVPSGGTADQVLTKTSGGYAWADAQGGGGGFKPIIRVSVGTGTVVTATKGSLSVSATSVNNEAVLEVPAFGVWTVSGTYGEKVTTTATVAVDTVKEYAVTIQLAAIYGVSWDKTASTVLSRTDDAALFSDPVPFVNNGMTGGDCSSPFDNILPWSGMVRVTDPVAGELVAIPKFWYKWTDTPTELKLQVAVYPVDGFHVSPAHADRGDGKGERDIVYIGRYHCASDYQSKTGVTPKNNVTRATARSGIHALGTNIWMNDFALFWTTRMLYLVEYADWDSQKVIGYGKGNDSATQAMGYTDTMPYHTGTMLTTKSKVGVGTQWRNIEGIWDNVVDWCDGIRFDGQNVYCFNRPADCSDTSGGTLVYNARPTTSNTISQWNVPTVQGFEYALYPAAVTAGGGTSYVASTCAYNSSGVALYIGGHFYTGREAGMFFLNGNSAANVTATHAGSRLQKLP